MTDIAAANLDALSRVIRTRPVLPEDRSRLAVETGPGGARTIVIAKAEGERVAAHSRRDPLGEARRQLANAVGDRPMPPLILLVGVGLGYLIDAIEERSPATRIVAIEPEPLCILPLLERRDFTALISSGRLLLLWGPEYVGWNDGWRHWDPWPEHTITIAHPVLSQLSDVYLQSAKAVVERMIFGARANAGARAKFAPVYISNTLRNLPTIADEADAAELFDAFPQAPAVVVAAGPSLNRNLPAIRAAVGGAVIIAVDTAVKPLLAAGIEPNIVVAVDPQEKNARHLSDAPVGDRTWLVAEASTNPLAFPRFRDRIFSCRITDRHPWPWLERLSFHRGALLAWGSVLTTAFDLACRMGCDPIMIAAADLAYTGDEVYCRNTTYEKFIGGNRTEAERAAASRQLIDQQTTQVVPDVHGRDTRTTASFLQFRDWLVSRSMIVERRVINVTGDGILHGGRIEQGVLSASPRTDLEREALSERLRGLWEQSVRSSRGGAEALEQAMDSRSAPLDEWVAFCQGGLDRDRLVQLIDSAWKVAPTVTRQPAAFVRATGWTVALEAQARGIPEPTVRWEWSDDGHDPWHAVPKASDSRCVLTPLASHNGRRYRAVFSSHNGVARTDPARLAVPGPAPGDWDGDGRSDILWRLASGRGSIWHLRGTDVVSVAPLDAEPDAGWRIAGCGDLNGDRRPEVLWRRSTTGELRFWELEGTSRTRSTALPAEPDPSWTIAVVADINADGRDEIVWRNIATGENRAWLVSGDAVTVAALDPEPDLAWQLVAAIPDGCRLTPALAWRHAATGEMRAWRMAGPARVAVVDVRPEPDLDWHVAGSLKLSAGGTSELLWRNRATLVVRLWQMDGLDVVGETELSRPAEAGASAASEPFEGAEPPGRLLAPNPGRRISTAPKRTVFLHIGYPKTGTSALQQFLAENEAVLRRHDTSYPAAARDSASNTHYPLVLATLARDGSLERLVAQVDADAGNCRTVILSTETFLDARLGVDLGYAVSRLAALGRIVVVTYIRRQDQWMQALYAQHVGFEPEPVSFAADEAAIVGRLPVGPLLDTRATCDALADLVGAANLVVRPYERHRLRGGDVREDLLAVAGLELTSEYALAGHVGNPSLRGDALEFVRINNALVEVGTEPGRIPPAVMREWMLSRRGARTFEAHSELSAACCQAIVDRYRAQNRDVAARYAGLPTDLFGDAEPAVAAAGWPEYGGLSSDAAHDAIAFASRHIDPASLSAFLAAAEAGPRRGSGATARDAEILRAAARRFALERQADAASGT